MRKEQIKIVTEEYLKKPIGGIRIKKNKPMTVKQLRDWLMQFPDADKVYLQVVDWPDYEVVPCILAYKSRKDRVCLDWGSWNVPGYISEMKEIYKREGMEFPKRTPMAKKGKKQPNAPSTGANHEDKTNGSSEE